MTSENRETRAPSDVNELLSKWIQISTAYGTAHADEAFMLARRHTRIGAPSVALSAIVGTSIFAAIQEAAESPGLKCVLALLSMTAASLAALVTFYNYAEKGARHKIASEEYRDVARRLEVLETSLTEMLPRDWRNVLEGYSQRLEAIGRRVDLPSAMVMVEAVEVEFRGMFPIPGSGKRVERVTRPKLMRDGFPSELEKVYGSFAERCV